ncbi:histidine kinase CKI1-like [Carica papaya]|uniref:histidine kinase CKI1-like n=1 Tax=Carica papaya TaxID=3649 RepID=UPI000B8C8D26|nr:histidine kinase CKI1-like [Carica papaya]
MGAGATLWCFAGSPLSISIYGNSTHKGFSHAFVVVLLPSSMIPCWYRTVKEIERDVKLSGEKLGSGLKVELDNTSKLLHPMNSSATNLARVLTSSLNTIDLLSFTDINDKIAPVLYLAFSTVSHVVQVSYIGSDGFFFSYYTNVNNETLAMYCNASFPSNSSSELEKKDYTWYTQPVDLNTGNLYGEATKQLPLDIVNTDWFEKALSSGSQGYVSLGTAWKESKDPLVLSTGSLNGAAVVSLGFSAKALTDFLMRGVNIYGGHLYLSTTDGEVLDRGLPNARMAFNNNSIDFSLLDPNGSDLVYALLVPQKGLVSIVNKNSKLAFLLLALMIGAVIISVFTFVYLTVRAAKRDVFLCANLIKQREATEQAERKSMNKSLAFASASHDIRTSLACISGLIEMCSAEVSSHSEIAANLQRMNNCTKDLVGLLNSILDISKIEDGKMQLEEEEFNLAQLIEEIVDLFYPAGMKKGVDIVLDPSDGSVMKFSNVRGDKGRLQQILNKDARNDLEAVNAIRTNPDSMEFFFEVDDTGKGIPKEKRKSIFENYVQVKETALGQGGIGLGLGIVQSLVRLMGGEIAIVDKEMESIGSNWKYSNPNPDSES